MAKMMLFRFAIFLIFSFICSSSGFNEKICQKYPNTPSHLHFSKLNDVSFKTVSSVDDINLEFEEDKEVLSDNSGNVYCIRQLINIQSTIQKKVEKSARNINIKEEPFWEKYLEHKKCLESFSSNEREFRSNTVCTLYWESEDLNNTGLINFCLQRDCNKLFLSDTYRFRNFFLGKKTIEFSNYHNVQEVNFNFTNIECFPKTTNLDVGAIIYLTTVVCILLCVVIGTTFSFAPTLFPKFLLNQKILDFFKCFCLKTNSRSFFDTTVKGKPEITCIHGIRVFTFVIIMITHVHLCICSEITELPQKILVDMRLPYTTLSVDVCFLMSGLLVTHSFLRKQNSWLSFYLHRYMRLTPVYAVIIGSFTLISSYVFKGNLSLTDSGNTCLKDWYYNFLYISNFIPAENVCFPWLWSLAVDMQFYVISPVYLIALRWRPKIGLLIILGLLFGSWIISFFLIYYYNLFDFYRPLQQPPDYDKLGQELLTYINEIYPKPYTRIGPYLIGALLAYKIFQAEGQRYIISKKLQISAWILSALILFAIFYPVYAEIPKVLYGLHNAVSRSLLTSCIAWIIFTCQTGYNGTLNRFLSHWRFILLSKFNYSAYMIHTAIILAVFNIWNEKFSSYVNVNMIAIFFICYILTNAIALVTFLMFEIPFRVLSTLYIRTNYQNRKLIKIK